MRIAIVSMLFNWPSGGGGIVETVGLGQALERAGYEVGLLYSRYDPWEIGQVSQPVPFAAEALVFDESSWHLPGIQRRFEEAVAAAAPDWVLVTDSWNTKPYLARAVRQFPYLLRFHCQECLCPLTNMRFIVNADGTWSQCTRHQLATPEACQACLEQRASHSGSLHRDERALCYVGSEGYLRTLREALDGASAVLVNNPLLEAMLEPYCRYVRVVTPGVEAERFPYAPLQAREAGAPVRLFMAGAVNELHKGFPVLHAACRMLWERRQDFALVATGSPPGPVDAFTTFTGWLSQEALPEQYAAADICVVPSVGQEAFGIVAAEAMAAGRPVVASRIGGLQFAVNDGQTGLLVAPGDLEGLAAALEYLIENPRVRAQMGQAGRARFLERYSWEAVVESHYRPILG